MGTLRAAYLVDQMGKIIGTKTTPVTLQEYQYGNLQADMEYQLSVGPLALAAGGHAKVTIRNPVGSGKLFVVFATQIVHTSTQISFCEWRYEPTSSLPATAVTERNLLCKSPWTANSQAVVLSGTSATTAMGGGTLIGTLALPGGRQNLIHQVPWCLAAGVMVGFNLPVSGADIDCVFRIAWLELPA